MTEEEWQGMKGFPEDWPAGCPSDDTPPADLTVYRIVKNNPPTAVDFLSHHETGRLPKADPCLRCGLSVFIIPDDAAHQRRLMPRLGRFIAMGILTAEYGKARPTPGQQPSHTTWWPFAGVDRVSPFTVVPEAP